MDAKELTKVVGRHADDLEEARIEAGDNRLIEWEVGIGEEMGSNCVKWYWVLYITI